MTKLPVKWPVMLALLLLVVVVMPWATIWSVNTLFGTAIEFNFFTWLATLILVGVVRPTVSMSK